MRKQIAATARQGQRFEESLGDHLTKCPDCRLYARTLRMAQGAGWSRCPDGQTLSELAGGGLSGDERTSVASHAAVCRRCARLVQGMLAVRLTDAPAPEAAPSRGAAADRVLTWTELAGAARLRIRDWLSDFVGAQFWSPVCEPAMAIQGLDDALAGADDIAAPVVLAVVDLRGEEIPGLRAEVIEVLAISDQGLLTGRFRLNRKDDFSHRLYVYLDLHGRGLLRIGPGCIDGSAPTPEGTRQAVFTASGFDTQKLVVPEDEYELVLE